MKKNKRTLSLFLILTMIVSLVSLSAVSSSALTATKFINVSKPSFTAQNRSNGIRIEWDYRAYANYCQVFYKQKDAKKWYCETISMNSGKKHYAFAFTTSKGVGNNTKIKARFGEDYRFQLRLHFTNNTYSDYSSVEKQMFAGLSVTNQRNGIKFTWANLNCSRYSLSNKWGTIANTYQNSYKFFTNSGKGKTIVYYLKAVGANGYSVGYPAKIINKRPY